MNKQIVLIPLAVMSFFINGFIPGLIVAIWADIRTKSAKNFFVCGAAGIILAWVINFVLGFFLAVFGILTPDSPNILTIDTIGSIIFGLIVTESVARYYLQQQLKSPLLATSELPTTTSTPLCPSCKRLLGWMPEQQKWYCPACNVWYMPTDVAEVPNVFHVSTTPSPPYQTKESPWSSPRLLTRWQGGVPLCPRCDKPLEWAEQRNKWLCSVCYSWYNNEEPPPPPPPPPPLPSPRGS